jgi:predicted rRNA methylase YqxC with S4 and FtsJ domains
MQNNITHCRCCHSDNIELVIDLGTQPWGNDYQPMSTANECSRYPLQTFFCHECTMVQLGFTVPKEAMFVEHNYLSGTTKSLRKHFSDVRDQILQRVDFLSEEYVLDIGGNDGTFLSTFLEKNIPVLNVDSGKRQAEISIKNNVPVLNDFFNKKTAEKILSEKGHAKVIHGSGVFFHLEELHSVFDGIQLLLAPNGMVVAEFIYLPSMIENGAFDQIYHEHLLYYTIRSFNTLLKKHGLEIHDAEILPIHGGSCIAFISHLNQNKLSNRLLELLADEEKKQYHNIETYKKFQTSIIAIREKLNALVKQFRQQNKTIQALGAPVKGSTIINYCGMHENDIICGVEINRLKCNTYFPGTKIPVYHQDEIAPPDAYLLLSWNFKDEILEKLIDFRNKGGKIIVPIPTPEII